MFLGLSYVSKAGQVAHFRNEHDKPCGLFFMACSGFGTVNDHWLVRVLQGDVILLLEVIYEGNFSSVGQSEGVLWLKVEILITKVK